MSMQLLQLRRFRPSRLSASVGFLFLASWLAPAVAHSATRAKAAAAPRGRLVGLSEVGLPRYTPPAAYREDLVIDSKNGDMTMRRFVDHGRIRTEMSSQGHDFIMIESGDSKGTMYTLMPEQKMAMKQSAPRTSDAESKAPKREKAGANPVPADAQVEDLGDDTIDGVAA